MPTSPPCAVAQVVHCKTRLAHGSKGAEISLCSSHQAALGRKVSLLKCSQGLHERVGLYPTTWFLLIYTEDSIFPPVFSLPAPWAPPFSLRALCLPGSQQLPWVVLWSERESCRNRWGQELREGLRPPELRATDLPD